VADQAAPSRPNVVLICADQWRGDALSVAGHDVVRTPFLDQMAQRGTRFARAYSGTPTCVPGRVGLMTGPGQRRHGRLGYRDGVAWSTVDRATIRNPAAFLTTTATPAGP